MFALVISGMRSVKVSVSLSMFGRSDMDVPRCKLFLPRIEIEKIGNLLSGSAAVQSFDGFVDYGAGESDNSRQLAVCEFSATLREPNDPNGLL